MKKKEENEWKFCNFHIPHKSQKKLPPFFVLWLPYLKSYFMVANLVMLNLVVLKITEKSQKHTRGGVLQTFIPTI